jgi:hypothetical protein
LNNVTNDVQTKASIVPNTAPTSGQLLIGNAGGTAYAPVSLSGDVTVNSSGVTAIGSAKVTNAMLAGSIDLTSKVTGALPSANGGFGSDVSAQSGVPLFATGTPTFTSTTGSGNFVRATAPTITGGSIAGLTSFGLRSSGSGAFDLTLANTENLSAGRTLTIKVNDAARTLDMAGNLTLAAAFSTSGANALTLTTTGSTNVTLPTSGTLLTTTGSGAGLSGIPNGALVNSTISGVVLGSNLAALTIGTGLSGTSYNGSAGVTIAVDQSFAPTWTGLHTFNRKITVTQGTASEGVFASTGGSNTGSNAASAFDLSWTLNTSGSPDVFALRVTDTARGSSTKLLNIYAGASGTTSTLNMDRNGTMRLLNVFATPGIYVYTDGSTTMADTGSARNIVIDGPTGIHLRTTWYLGWVNGDAAGSPDTAMARLSAGLIGVGTGSTGSFAGRLKLTSAIYAGTTIANLNASPTTGEIASITDGDAGLAWGAAAVNSGGSTTKYIVWYNGTNWTVMGK